MEAPCLRGGRSQWIDWLSWERKAALTRCVDIRRELLPFPGYAMDWPGDRCLARGARRGGHRAAKYSSLSILGLLFLLLRPVELKLLGLYHVLSPASSLLPNGRSLLHSVLIN